MLNGTLIGGISDFYFLASHGHFLPSFHFPWKESAYRNVRRICLLINYFVVSWFCLDCKLIHPLLNIVLFPIVCFSALSGIQLF